MYLSRIEMELSDKRTRIAMEDAQQMHRLLNGLFSEQRKDVNLLYRIRISGVKIIIYLYSDIPLDRERLLPGMICTGERDLTNWLERMQEGQLLGFDILTMPYKKVKSADCKNSRRVLLKTREERLAWLKRKADQNGFDIHQIEENENTRISVVHTKEKGGKLYMNAFRYSGILEIMNAEAFREAVKSGIGAGKAYGLGMMLLRG